MPVSTQLLRMGKIVNFRDAASFIAITIGSVSVALATQYEQKPRLPDLVTKRPYHEFCQENHGRILLAMTAFPEGKFWPVNTKLKTDKHLRIALANNCPVVYGSGTGHHVFNSESEVKNFLTKMMAIALQGYSTTISEFDIGSINIGDIRLASGQLWPVVMNGDLIIFSGDTSRPSKDGSRTLHPPRFLSVKVPISQRIANVELGDKSIFFRWFGDQDETELDLVKQNLVFIFKTLVEDDRAMDGFKKHCITMGKKSDQPWNASFMADPINFIIMMVAIATNAIDPYAVTDSNGTWVKTLVTDVNTPFNVFVVRSSDMMDQKEKNQFFQHFTYFVAIIAKLVDANANNKQSCLSAAEIEYIEESNLVKAMKHDTLRNDGDDIILYWIIFLLRQAIDKDPCETFQTSWVEGEQY